MNFSFHIPVPYCDRDEQESKNDYHLSFCGVLCISILGNFRYLGMYSFMLAKATKTSALLKRIGTTLQDLMLLLCLCLYLSQLLVVPSPPKEERNQ